MNVVTQQSHKMSFQTKCGNLDKCYCECSVAVLVNVIAGRVWQSHKEKYLQ